MQWQTVTVVSSFRKPTTGCTHKRRFLPICWGAWSCLHEQEPQTFEIRESKEESMGVFNTHRASLSSQKLLALKGIHVWWQVLLER